MKKTILLLAANIFLNASNAFAAENSFYLKANLGLSKLSKLQSKQNVTRGLPEINLKSNNDIHLGIGVGYNLQKNVRFDLIYDHYVKPTHKTSINSAEPFINNNVPQGCIRHQKGNNKIKTNIDTLLFNGYVDLFEINSIKVFVGAGFGVSAISGKSVESLKETLTQGETILYQDDEVKTSTAKLKSKTHAAYAAYLGASYEFTKNIIGDFTYSFRRLGSIFKTNEGLIMGHHLTAGIRFNI